MFLLGVSLAVIGAAAPAIGLSAGEVGILLTVQNAGFVLSVIAFGYLSDIRSRSRLLAGSALILGVTFFLLYRSPIFFVNALVMAGIGLGIGGIEAVTDPLLLGMYTRRRSLIISANHLAVTLGSLLITVYLIFLQLDWQRSMVQAGIAAIVLAGAFAFFHVKPSGGTRLTPRERLSILGREPQAAIMFGAMICAYGMQVASIGIIPTFLIELRGFEPVPANLGLVTFISGMAIGRVIVGSITREHTLVRNLRVLFTAGTLCMAFVYFIDVGTLVFPFLFLGGLLLSALLPLIITYTGTAYPHIVGTATGAIKVAIPGGGLVVPFLMSVVAQTAGTQVSLIVPPLAGACGALLLGVYHTTLRTGIYAPSDSGSPQQPAGQGE